VIACIYFLVLFSTIWDFYGMKLLRRTKPHSGIALMGSKGSRYGSQLLRPPSENQSGVLYSVTKTGRNANQYNARIDRKTVGRTKRNDDVKDKYKLNCSEDNGTRRK
jgi:hypothetical protein